jgi:hypothetical protein
MTQTPRSPVQEIAGYRHAIEYGEKVLDEWSAAAEAGDLNFRRGTTRNVANWAHDVVLLRYSAGEPVAQLSGPAVRIAEAYMTAQAATSAYADSLPGKQGDVWRAPIWGVRGQMYELSLGLAMLLATGAEVGFVQRFVRCVGQAGECGLWDRWCRVAGLDPDRVPAARPRLETQYGPLVDALDAPASQRAHAVGAYLQGWSKRMRAFPWADETYRGDGAVGLWSWEVACSVMIYGIDDASFRDHRHYPRDLVDHFRAHGTPLAVSPWQPPAPAAQAPARAPIKKRRTHIDTWLAYVTEGDDTVIAAAREQWPELVDGYDSLVPAIEVLQSNAHALRVDVKDAAEAVSQAAAIAGARRLDGDVFELPQQPVEPTLAAIDRWFEARGYRLLDIDTDADEYAAVAVRAELLDDALAVSRKLKLSVAPAALRFDAR